MNGYETEREIRVTKERSVTGHKKGFLQEMTEVWDEQEKKETRILSPILGTGPLVLNRGSTGGGMRRREVHIPPPSIHSSIYPFLPWLCLLEVRSPGFIFFFSFASWATTLAHPLPVLLELGYWGC